jgi:RHS repeat-associated protein
VTNTGETNRDVLDIKENRIPSTTPPVSSFNYGVNNIGQRTGVQTSGLAFDTSPADWVWGYDALGQVTSADSPTNTHDRAYEYDAIGNRKRSADGALVTTGAATVYDANNLNQYSEIQNQQSSIVNPVHDADGNATSYPLPPAPTGSGVAPTTNATLAYDGENRLVSVTTPDPVGAGGATTVSYVYDPQSRRVARTESPLPLGEGQGEGAQHTLHLYDGWNCLAEYVLHTSSFNLHTSHTWGLDLSGSLQGAGGVGGLLSVTKHQEQSITHFPTFDGNGNISEYLDTTGNWVAHFEYDPFGRAIVASGDHAGDFSYRFSTKPVDPATGLCYYGYRWYDPETGRWQSRDPIEEEGGVNLYGFVLNTGVNFIDHLGLELKKRPCMNEISKSYPSYEQYDQSNYVFIYAGGAVEDYNDKRGGKLHSCALRVCQGLNGTEDFKIDATGFGMNFLKDKNGNLNLVMAVELYLYLKKRWGEPDFTSQGATGTAPGQFVDWRDSVKDKCAIAVYWDGANPGHVGLINQGVLGDKYQKYTRKVAIWFVPCQCEEKLCVVCKPCEKKEGE